MKRLLLTVAGVGLTTSLVFAQTQTVRGVVVEAGTGEAVIGANVIVKGHSGVGVTTNLDGKFALNVPKGATHLIVSYIGYKKAEVAISPNMKITLQTDTQSLDDVVVVGYGVQKKESLVGTQTTVSAKNLAKRPITNATTALAGLTPGVQLTTGAGQPGAAETIIIRGAGSINAGATPVYVVDGSIYNGAIGDISPSDIQSIDILKDAASTAIYGSSAGNGVVLITTKNGAYSRESKPTFTFTMNQGVSQRGQKDYERLGAEEYYTTRWQQWYNQYTLNEDLFKESFEGKTELAGAQAAIDVYSDLKYNPFAGIKSYYNKDYSIGNKPTGYPVIVRPDGTLNPEITGLLYGDDLDWEGALLRTGHRQEYTFSGAYNNDKLKSYFALSYLGEKGYRINTDFSRFSARTNLSYQFTKWFEAGTNTSFSRSETIGARSLGTAVANSFSFVRNIGPIYPIHKHDAEGKYIYKDGEKEYDYDENRPYRSRYNTILESQIDLNRLQRDLISNRTFIAYKPIEGLTLKANVGYDLTNYKRRVRFNNLMGDQPKGYLQMDPNRYSTLTFNQLADYAKSFGKNNLSLLLGHESYSYDEEIVELGKQGAIVSGVDEYSAYLTTTGLRSYTHTYRKESYFTRINYDYDARYNFSFSFRRDGSSRFDRSERWGNFWSFGAGWNLHKEQFIKNIKWINQLKLRASIGQTGNDDLRELSDKSESSYYPSIDIYGMGASRANNDRPGLYIDQIGTRNLLWEKQTSSDLAIEARLFNRLSLSLELFNKASENLLFAYPRPLSSGIGETAANLGQVRNYGLEFDVKYAILQQANFNWDIFANGTFLNNKIVRLPEENRQDGILVPERLQKYEEGRSIYEFYTREYLGVDPSNGLALYRIDRERYPTAQGIDDKAKKDLTYNSDYAAQHFAGSSVPVLQGGFGSNVSYKAWDLGVSFTYQLGGKLYDVAYSGLMFSRLNSGNALHIDALKAWRKPGDQTDVPRFDAGQEGTKFASAESDRFITSSNGLMFKSLTLGYTLPKNWLKSFGISSARISVAGENLFLLSARQGLNPFGTFTGYQGGATYGYARTLTTSLSITL